MPTKRRAKTVGVSQALAASVRSLRERENLTQDDLAKAMQELGFRWVRVTVSQVEGQRREISVAELLGLASMFGVGVDQLLWPDGSAEGLKVSSKLILDRDRLMAGLLTMRVVMQWIDAAKADGGHAMQMLMTERLGRAYRARVHELADELRGTAAWIEEKAAETLGSP